MKCRIKFCRHQVSLSEKSPICSMHRARNWKKNWPFHYAYAKLKFRAKERGHDFTITREQFVDFCKANGYAEDRSNAGKTKECLSIDRIDNARGYHIDNIQVLTISENARKQYVDYAESESQDPDWSVQ